MHWKIIDCYFNVFFVEIQLKKKTWKVDFGCQSIGVILIGGGGGGNFAGVSRNFEEKIKIA